MLVSLERKINKEGLKSMSVYINKVIKEPPKGLCKNEELTVNA